MPDQTNINARARKTSRTVQAIDSETVLDPKQLCQADFEVAKLAHTPFVNPCGVRQPDAVAEGIISDSDRRIMYDPITHEIVSGKAVSTSAFTMRLAQARQNLHFDPANTVVGIVTCGGLCPGLNDVIRGLTYVSIRSYGVRRVIGFRYGFWGLSAAGRAHAMELDTSTVRSIHRRGGTFLGTSRGPQTPSEMVDTLLHYKINVLFTVGGDGTQRGAAKIAAEARRRGLDIAVIGIPKTIDNDLSFSHRTFGFETAVAKAVEAIRSAHSEAFSHKYGIGIVKVMGRHSGFIAAQATVASQQVNMCLIPEADLTREQVMTLLEARFKAATFCVICVAEGFGQGWLQGAPGSTDASGNKKLVDIGVVLKKEVSKWMETSEFKGGTVKYIDPSYMIRACPPSASDAAFCVHLATLAVHEAMHGVTDAIMSYWYDNYIAVPIRLATALRKVVALNGQLWRQVREVTVDSRDTRTKKETIQRQLDSLDVRRRQLVDRLSKL